MNISPIGKRRCSAASATCAAARLNDPRWGKRQNGEGIFAEQIGAMFEVACRRAGIGERPKLSTAAFRRTTPQMELF